jgi:hypothetical protein
MSDSTTCKQGNNNLEFGTISLSDFEEKFKSDSFLSNIAGDLLLPYRFSNEHIHGPWIAGGLLTRTVQGEKLEDFSGDIDVFFYAQDQRVGYMRTLDENIFGLNATKSEKFKSDYSWTYEFNYHGKDIKLQLICYRTFANIKSLLSRFDMFSCMFGTDGINVFFEKDNAIECAMQKQMKYNWGYLNETTAHPDARYVLKRYTKFIRNGYKITDKELYKFSELIKKIPNREFKEGEGAGYLHV